MVYNKLSFAFSAAYFAGIFWDPEFDNQDFALFFLNLAQLLPNFSMHKNY